MNNKRDPSRSDREKEPESESPGGAPWELGPPSHNIGMGSKYCLVLPIWGDDTAEDWRVGISVGQRVKIELFSRCHLAGWSPASSARVNISFEWFF
jgi:hypothetical protein